MPGAADQVVYWLSINPGGKDGPRSGSYSRQFSGLLVIGTVDIIGVLSNPVPIYMYTVVQRWLLATDRDCIAIGLSLSLHPCIELNTDHPKI